MTDETTPTAAEAEAAVHVIVGYTFELISHTGYVLGTKLIDAVEEGLSDLGQHGRMWDLLHNEHIVAVDKAGQLVTVLTTAVAQLRLAGTVYK